VAQHKEWNEDVAAFEKANPNITIKSVTYTGQCEVPAQFTATLRAGTETNLFYAYFTDLHQVLNAGQAADITSYVNSKTVPALADIVPSAMAAETAGKTLYGLPTSNYTQGLIINRKLFTQAGLDPNKPPTTWAEVEKDAKAIAALGHGIYGYGDYSASPVGGWHFTSEMDAMGGQIVGSNGQAAFNSSTNAPQATAIRRPMDAGPAKATLSTPGCRASISATSCGPVTRLKTPGGKSAASNASARMYALSEVCRAGLSTTVQPAASAGANWEKAIVSG